MELKAKFSCIVDKIRSHFNSFTGMQSPGQSHYYSRIPNETVQLETPNLEPSDEGITFSPDEAISHIGFGIFHIKLFLVLGLIVMVEGMEIFVLSVLAPYLRCQWNLTYFEETFLAILTSVGMMISAPVWGWICDIYGRKKGLYISSVWFMYFAFLSTFSPNYKWLVFLRFLVGVGIGSLPQALTLLAKYTPTKVRGKLLTFIAVFWSVGFIFATLLSLWLMVDYDFRVLLGALCIPGVLFICCFWWMPESFRYYAATGQTEETLEMLRHIAKQNGADLPPGKLKLQPPPPAEEHDYLNKLVNILRGGYRRLTLTVWLIWLINVLMYYASVYVTTEIFQRYYDNICFERDQMESITCRTCRVLTREDYFDVMLASLGEFPGIIISLCLVDYLGRKWTMCFVAFMAIIFESFLFLCLNRVGVTLVLMATRCALLGQSSIIFLYTAEAYPTSIRGTGMGSGFLFGRLGMLLAPLFAQALFHWSVMAAKYFFVSALVVGFLAAFSLPFDTRDREFV